MLELTDILKAFGDSSRLRIISLLEQGPLSVQDITGVLGLGQSTVSHHLKVLQSSDCIRAKKDGVWTFFSLNAELLAQPEKVEISQHSLAQLLQSILSCLQNGITGSLQDQLTKDRHAVRILLDTKREDARKFFNSVAADWKDLRKHACGPVEALDLLVERIPAEADFLELGCGAGSLLEHIVPRNGKTFGVDISQAMIDEAKRSLGASSENVDLRVGSLEHLPLPNDAVDLAAAFMVFHHLSSPSEALKDAHRVLKPGGKILILDFLPHEHEHMREHFADVWLGFDPELFKSWITQAGFTDVDMEFLGKPGEGESKDVFLLTAYKPEKE